MLDTHYCFNYCTCSVNKHCDSLTQRAYPVTISCLPMQFVTNNVSNNHWITAGIKVSCKCRKYLYIMKKTTNCSKIEVHYIQYCRVLQKVSRKTKEMYCSELFSSSTNKSKTFWASLIMKRALRPVRSLLRLNLNMVTKI